MFLHDVIKILYINLGYLPNYPYHLITDSEMFDAFCKDSGVFADYYPCPGEDLSEAYDTLKAAIDDKISAYLTDGTEIPEWVYSYLLIQATTYESNEADIAYLYELSGIEPEDTVAQFSENLAKECYAVSTAWIKRLPSLFATRPATVFGEPHVLKSLRLNQANILLENGES